MNNNNNLNNIANTKSTSTLGTATELTEKATTAQNITIPAADSSRAIVIPNQVPSPKEINKQFNVDKAVK